MTGNLSLQLAGHRVWRFTPSTSAQAVWYTALLPLNDTASTSFACARHCATAVHRPKTIWKRQMHSTSCGMGGISYRNGSLIVGFRFTLEAANGPPIACLLSKTSTRGADLLLMAPSRRNFKATSMPSLNGLFNFRSLQSCGTSLIGHY